jgi:predicted dinucleotide-binding enzyme
VTTVRISVIGSGNVGSAIARAAKRTGHDVTVAAVDAGELEALGKKLGVATTTDVASAGGHAEIVALAVPYGAVGDVASQLVDSVAGKIVIDATNPLASDSSSLATVERSGAELLQEELPAARVVKAFNTVFAANQDKAEVDGVQLDGFVASDDSAAKAVVSRFLEQIGYRVIDAGPLRAARYLEAMAFLNISLNAANGWPWRTGWKLIGPMDTDT